MQLLARSRAADLALAALGALALLWCVASLWFPFGWDQGIMAAVGDVIVRGGLPYRDGWDMKGPLAFYGFAAAEWLFGRNMWAIRVLDVGLLGVACYALARVVSRFSTPRVGLWAAVAFALWYASLTWFFVSQPDGWVAMLVLIGMAPLLARPERTGAAALLWSGLLIGCCALVKPFYAAFLLVPGVYALAAHGPLARKALALSVLAVAAAIPPLVAVAWFVSRNAFDSLLEVHVLYAGAYADSLRPDLVARRVFNYFWSTGSPTPTGAVAVVLPAIAFGAWALWREHRQLALTLVTWLGVALFCVAIQGKFWVYHWVPTFPPFIALAAAGLWQLGSAAPGRAAPARLLAIISAALFLGQIMVTPTVDVGRWVLLMTGIKSRAEYYRQHFRRHYVAADNMEAARHIRDRTVESDGVAVWGNDATITYLSGRASPTRFVFAMPLTRPVADSLRTAYRREYVSALTARPPRYFVIGQPHDGSADKAAVLRSFPELDALVRSRYRLEREIGFLELYRLDDMPATAAERRD